MSSTLAFDRTTSSGYRFPPARPHTTVGVRTAAGDAERANRTTTQGGRERHYTTTPQRFGNTAGFRSSTTVVPAEMDAVARDRIVTNTILNARRRDRLWETQWGFVLELDPKGEPKPRKVLPETVSLYSNSVPNTDGSNYGSRLNTDSARRIQNLETRFYSANKKRKMGSDLICY